MLGRVGVKAFLQRFPKKSMIGRCEGAIASTSSPLDICIRPIDQVGFSGTVCCHWGAWGRWEFTNEQQVDEVGDSWRSVALYSRPGSGRICDSARRNGGAKRWRTASAGLVRHQHRRLGLPEHQPAAHMFGSHHSSRRLVNAVDVFRREISAPGGVARGRSRRATNIKPSRHFARRLF